jgi:hypothetical protein
MSLINEALKRATKAQDVPAPAGSTGAPMRAADGHGSTGLPRYFVPVLLCVFCGAFWFIVRGWDARRQSEFYPKPITLHARETAAAAANPDPASVPNGAIPENRHFSLNDEPAQSASSTTPPAGTAAPAATIAPAAPVESEYRLQGIFYRPTSPSAVVNAKTVYVGDLISGARVKAIDRQSVTLERGGQTQVLTLQ